LTNASGCFIIFKDYWFNGIDALGILLITHIGMLAVISGK